MSELTEALNALDAWHKNKDAEPEPAIIQTPEPGWEYQIVWEGFKGLHDLSIAHYKTPLPKGAIGFYTPSKRRVRDGN